MFALFGQGEDQSPARAGDTDVGQAPFLFDVIAFNAVAVRQQLFFHAHDKHPGEFQAFGGMQGHQLYLVVDGFFLLALQQVAQDEFVDGRLDAGFFIKQRVIVVFQAAGQGINQ